jgi:hypothetical protein
MTANWTLIVDFICKIVFQDNDLLEIDI